MFGPLTRSNFQLETIGICETGVLVTLEVFKKYMLSF